MNFVALMLRPVQTDAQLSYPLETCSLCGWQFHDYPFRTCRPCRVVHVIEISTADVQFDVAREADQHGISLPRYLRENR